MMDGKHGFLHDEAKRKLSRALSEVVADPAVIHDIVEAICEVIDRQKAAPRSTD